mmetsp:Transcript_23945/g.67067  ORF Transcript_23945/g.67067 Transcript_23945/m.67067 type:complete len:231 (-) Transcript_23945:1260-1952(-)
MERKNERNKREYKVRWAEQSDSVDVHKVVNYAYRGGAREKGWTGEEHLVVGDRMTLEDVSTLLNKTQSIIHSLSHTRTSHRSPPELYRIHTSSTQKVQVEEMVLVVECPHDYDEEVDTKILGCIKIEVLPDGRAEFGLFSVHPNVQGKGVGTVLLNMAEKCASAANCGKGIVRVIHCRPELINWYNRISYLPSGETDSFPPIAARVGVPLRSDLFFVVLEKQLPPYVADN